MSAITIIACGIFRAELEHLQRTGDLKTMVVYTDSMLHMHPAQLASTLTAMVAQQRRKGARVLLLFGDCHAGMVALANQPGVARVVEDNCIAIMLGKERYRALRRRRAFVLMNDWAHRWQGVFEKELGFDRTTGRQFMRDHHDELVYLDTGIAPVPTAVMDACAAWCGLSWRLEVVSLEPFKTAIADGLNRLETEP